jgi:hypothetical protein
MSQEDNLPLLNSPDHFPSMHVDLSRWPYALPLVPYCLIIAVKRVKSTSIRAVKRDAMQGDSTAVSPGVMARYHKPQGALLLKLVTNVIRTVTFVLLHPWYTVWYTTAFSQAAFRARPRCCKCISFAHYRYIRQEFEWWKLERGSPNLWARNTWMNFFLNEW